MDLKQTTPHAFGSEFERLLRNQLQVKRYAESNSFHSNSALVFQKLIPAPGVTSD